MLSYIGSWAQDAVKHADDNRADFLKNTHNKQSHAHHASERQD